MPGYSEEYPLFDLSLMGASFPEHEYCDVGSSNVSTHVLRITESEIIDAAFIKLDQHVVDR